MVPIIPPATQRISRCHCVSMAKAYNFCSEVKIIHFTVHRCWCLHFSFLRSSLSDHGNEIQEIREITACRRHVRVEVRLQLAQHAGKNIKQLKNCWTTHADWVAFILLVYCPLQFADGVSPVAPGHGVTKKAELRAHWTSLVWKETTFPSVHFFTCLRWILLSIVCASRCMIVHLIVWDQLPRCIHSSILGAPWIRSQRKEGAWYWVLCIVRDQL